MSSVNTAVKLPSMRQILLLALTIVGCIVLFSVVNDVPVQVPLVISWFCIIGLGVMLGHSYNALQKGLIDGIAQGGDAILVLIAVGALIGSWIAGGVVPNIIYFGLSIMRPEYFLVGAFFVCSVTSLATGTSFGTAGTAGVAMMGIGASFGLPLPLVAGAVISGAYVGDKLSPLSDTTVMAASLCEVNIVEHIKSMLMVSLPAIAIAAGLFLAVGFLYDFDASNNQTDVVIKALEQHFSIGWYMLLPAIIVIALLVLKFPSVPVIFFGALLGVIWAMVFESNSFTMAFGSIVKGNSIQSDLSFLNILLNRGGIQSMANVVVIIILALGLGGLMRTVGVLETISTRIKSWATSIGRLTSATMLAGIMGNMVGGAAYVAIITASTLTKQNYQQLNIDKRVLSRNTEAGATIPTPMIPWSDGGIFMASTLGVATVSYLPFLWYHLLVIVISLIYGKYGWFSYRKN